MKLEFSREEVLALILAHANRICPLGRFNNVSELYGYVSNVVVSVKEAEERAGDEAQ
jgi:hypothetical protein